ncbi:helix-turn-helix transcriptional regulator [Clostridium sp.]|uniref:helix-turn-helix transcriptional regulator n=1 Tax=Clostridium sp. TaxID=1506 RepID=UPI003216D3FE
MIGNFKVTNRLKYYRNILNISQKELVTENLSLQQIKFIETKRRKITYRTAEIISNQLNYIAKHKNINLNISTKELVMGDEDYARYLCKIELRKKEEIDTENFETICLQYNLKDILQDYYKLQGEILEDQNEFQKSLDFYTKAKDMGCLEEYSYIYILNKIGACHVCLCNWALGLKSYTEAEILIKLVYKKSNYEIRNIQDIESRVYYGIALINNEIGNYKISLEYIESIKKLKYVESKLIIDSSILEANMNYEMGNIEKSINNYMRLHEEFPENSNIIINLVTLYELVEDEERSNFYLNKINRDMLKREDASLYVAYLLKRKNYFIKFDVKAAVKHYNTAIKLCINDNNILWLTKIYENIVQDYHDGLINSNYVNQYLIILNRNKHIYDNHKELLNDILIGLITNKNINRSLLDTIRKIKEETL